MTVDRRITSYFPEEIGRFASMDRNAFFRELLLMDWIPAGTVMCTRKALLEIGGFREFASAGFVDYPTWLALTSVGEVKAIDELLGYWRQHSEQITASELPQIIEASADIVLSHFLSLPDDVKQKTGLTYTFLRKQRRILTGDTYYDQAKVVWQQGRRSLARKRFARSLILGDFGVKKMAFLAFCLTYTRADHDFFSKHFQRSAVEDLEGSEKSER